MTFLFRGWWHFTAHSYTIRDSVGWHLILGPPLHIFSDRKANILLRIWTGASSPFLKVIYLPLDGVASCGEREA